MATLADINATLLLQTEAIGRQADAVTKSNDILDVVRQRISDMLKVQETILKDTRQSDERARKTKIEDKRETIKTPLPKTFMAGFAQGTGFSWLSDFVSGTLGSLFGKGGSLLGLLAGAIGKAAGKLLIWGLLGTAIVNYFGDELKIAADKIDEWFGIDLVKYFKDNPIMAAAATAAAGAIAIAMSKLVARIAFRAVGALGAAGLTALGFGAGAAGAGAAGAGAAGAGAAANKTSWFKRLLGKSKLGKVVLGATALGAAGLSYLGGGSGGAPDVIPPTTQPKVSATGPTSAQKAALAAIPDSKLPVGFARNAAGKVYNTATGKLAKTSEILDLMKGPGAGKWAKYGKLLKFLGAAGTIIPALADPAFAIYEGAPEDVIKTQLAGALGSVSGAYLGGIVGGAAGGAVGSIAPGVGTAVVGFIGALGGSIAGAVAGESLAEELTNFLLGNPVHSYATKKVDLQKPGTDASGRPYVVQGGKVGVMGGRAGNLFVPNNGQTPAATDQRENRVGTAPLLGNTPSELFDINDPLVKAKAPPPGHGGEKGNYQAVSRYKVQWVPTLSAKTLFDPSAVPADPRLNMRPKALPSTTGSSLQQAQSRLTSSQRSALSGGVGIANSGNTTIKQGDTSIINYVQANAPSAHDPRTDLSRLYVLGYGSR